MDNTKKEENKNIRFVCISDTHNKHSEVTVPDGDVLIHSGDFTWKGEPHEMESFVNWLAKLPHKVKIVIAGNHELPFDEPRYERIMTRINDYKKVDIPEGYCKKIQKMLTGCIYLEDSSTEVYGYKIYGAPHTPYWGGWAFNVKQDQIGKKWEMIPTDTDILITHGPPFGICDKTAKHQNGGCKALKKQVTERIKPIAHIFGHIHEGYGAKKVGDTYFINAAQLNEYHQAVNAPIVFDLPDRSKKVDTKKK